MTKQEEIQDEAVKILLPLHRRTAAISIRTGKTLIGLRIARDCGAKKILVVVPKLTIINSWKDDMAKFGINLNISYTTYISLPKNPLDWDLVIFDEIHAITESAEPWLENYKGSILGLTGTPPKHEKSIKYKIINKYSPVKYSYLLKTGSEDGILSDYKVFIHSIKLDNQRNIPVKKRDGNIFYTSETNTYDYWTTQIEQAVDYKTKQIKSVMRMKSMQTFPSKEKYAASILQDLVDSRNKVLIFCNTTDQADKICSYSHHSKNPESKENLQMFKDGIIPTLACVDQLSEGVSLPGLDTVIIFHAYSNEKKSIQRLGRALLPDKGKISHIHILQYSNTVDEKWISEALSDLDQNKIIYL